MLKTFFKKILKNKPLKRILKVSYYTSSIIIAFIAIFGYRMSVRSAKETSIILSKTSNILNETSNALQKIDTSINSYIQPLLEFSNCSWFTKGKMGNCDNPPYAINTLYINASNVTIKIKNPQIKIYYGDIRIDSSDFLNNNDKDEYITLATNREFGITRLFTNEAVKKLLKNQKHFSKPPFYRIDFSAIITTMNESKRYKINLINDIGLDCRDYSKKNLMTIKTSYVSF